MPVACAVAAILFLSLWPMVAEYVRAEEEPSLEETMEWMQSKVETSYVVLCNVGGTEMRCGYIHMETKPTIAACNINYAESSYTMMAIGLSGEYTKVLDKGSKVGSQNKIVLGKLNASTVTVKPLNGGYYKIVVRDSKGNEVRIPFTPEKDLAERFAKALRYAIKVCGGQDKKEAF